MKMSRQDGHPDKDALALNFAAAQQAAGSPFGMVPPSHGLHGMQPSMMNMMPSNFFAMNQNISSLNPNVAAAMMVDSRQHPSAANNTYSHAAAFHNNMIVHPQHAAVNPAAAAAAAVVMKHQQQQQQQQELQPRLVHDAASAPRLIEAPLPKRGPGRPIGSGRGKIRQHDLIHASGPRGTDPQTGFPFFSDSPTLTSQDSSEISVPNAQTHPPSKPASISASAATAHAQVIFGSGRPEMPPPKWYAASVPLGVEDDQYYLSELHCLLRSEFVEVFGTTETELDLPHQGRIKPIALGQVGLRCKHCKDLPSCVRVNHAVVYPSFVSAIYNSVQQMYRMHFLRCESIPQELKNKVATLETHNISNRGGRKQYWIEAAKRIGLCDTQYGIHYEKDPTLPLPPFVGWQEEKDEPKPAQEEPEYYPLVLPDDKELITDYLYLAMEQMQPCNLMDADRVGCYKGRQLGFPGLACKHCVGQAGCGRYFPASEASLSQTTTSQTIVNHVRNCRRCPIDIREQLEFMKMSKAVTKKSDKPKHGGRKVFFRRLWCRIQRIPITEDELAEDVGKKKDGSKGPKKRKNSESNSSDTKKSKVDAPEAKEQGNTTTTDSVDVPNKKKKIGQKYMFNGNALLAKGDDAHWLSQAEVFIRKELVEVFTATADDKINFGEPEVGQVGIRCTHCAKNKPKDLRAKGHVCYPASMNRIQQCVKDLHSRHLAICGAIPDKSREKLRSLKGYGSKSLGDASQYWIDSAKELGLQDSPDGLGVAFFRNPGVKSPADCLDFEKRESLPSGSFIIRADDRESVTDSMTLLLKQFRPCRFEASDRRGSRSRDRALGSPGIYCIHCSRKRYFPVTEKKLIDTLILMKTHMNTCSNVPEAVKSSLSYLQHRSLLQKQKLGGQWKSKLFKKVWSRLHHEDWSDFDYSSPPSLLEAISASKEAAEAENSVVTVTRRDSIGHRDSIDETTERTGFFAETNSPSFALDEDSEEASEALKGMQDMIKAAAVWLSERDEEQEKKRQARSTKSLGQGKNRLGFRGRGGARMRSSSIS